MVTRHGAFHGVTYGAMNCDGGYHATRTEIYLGEDRFGIAAPPADEGTAWGPGARYSSGAAEIRRAVEAAGPAEVAAVIVDGASSASGVAVPPAEDLRAIRALCDEYGILLIVDEVITGFCRTGDWFISTKYGVEPDLMPISKAMSSGYMPIGGTMVADRIVELFLESAPEDSVLSHGQTFAAHPVACAVSLENILIMEERDFRTRAATQGEALRATLASLGDHPCFVDVRGVGMVNGLEAPGWTELGLPRRPRRSQLAAAAPPGPGIDSDPDSPGDGDAGDATDHLRPAGIRRDGGADPRRARCSDERVPMTWSVSAGLEDKVVVVTGAAGGIGSAVARAFDAAGSRVCAIDPKEQELGEVVASLGDPSRHMALTADLAAVAEHKGCWRRCASGSDASTCSLTWPRRCNGGRRSRRSRRQTGTSSSTST